MKIKTLGVDDWFGEEDLVNNTNRTYTVMCEQSGELIMVSKRMFFHRIFNDENGKKNILERIDQKR